MPRQSHVGAHPLPAGSDGLQSHRALEYLHPDNLRFPLYGYLDAVGLPICFRVIAPRPARSLPEALSISQTSASNFSTILAINHLGRLQEFENQLYQAAETYRRFLQLLSDQPPPNANEAYLGLARIFYEWNDLDAAEQHGQQSLQLARQYDKSIDRFVLCEVFLARLKLARGDVAGAAAMLAETEQSVRQNNFVQRMPEVAAAQVMALLRQGNLAAAADLARKYELPLIRARVLLAQGDPSAALAVLRPLRQQMEAQGLADERFKAMILQAVALRANGEKDQAVQLLGEALALAEPGGSSGSSWTKAPRWLDLLSEAAAARDHAGLYRQAAGCI